MSGRRSSKRGGHAWRDHGHLGAPSSAALIDTWPGFAHQHGDRMLELRALHVDAYGLRLGGPHLGLRLDHVGPRRRALLYSFSVIFCVRLNSSTVAPVCAERVRRRAY